MIAAWQDPESLSIHSMALLKILADFVLKGVLLLAAAGLLNIFLNKASAAGFLSAIHGPTWILIAWAAVVMTVMSWRLAGRMGVWRMKRAGRPITDDSWRRLLKRLADQLGIKRKVRLIESDESIAPVTWGVFRPVILLPSQCARWTDEQRRAILLHELVHIRRLDDLAQIIAQVACAVHWFDPLAWMAARRLRIERERACDDQVLLAGTKASDYATILLEAVRNQRHLLPSSLLAALPMASRSKIETRLLAILDPTQSRRAPSAMGLVAVSMSAVCLWIGLATAHPTTRADLSIARKNMNQTQYGGAASKTLAFLAPWRDAKRFSRKDAKKKSCRKRPMLGHGSPGQGNALDGCGPERFGGNSGNLAGARRRPQRKDPEWRNRFAGVHLRAAC